MSSFVLRRFSNPDALKSITPAHLLALLQPYRDFFSLRNVTLPTSLNGMELDYDGIVGVLMTPDADTPQDLADALYYVHEMATPEDADDLMEELRGQGISLDGGDHTPADIAVKVWLSNRDILERKHAEQVMAKPRSFDCYQTDRDPVPEFRTPSETKLRSMAQDLDEWFNDKKRGHGARVFLFPRQNEFWFLVRHGELFKREGSLEDGEPKSIYYRPAKHDVVIYDPVVGEIRVNACTQKEKQLYREKFGQHIFGDSNFFPGQNKYTLDPLGQNGVRSLVCNDVNGLDSVQLKEIQIFRGGNQGEVEIRRAKDIFLALEERGRDFPRGRLIRASLSVKFTSAKVPRTVTIRPPNVARYTRDSDGTVVEEFLKKRRFILERSETIEDGEETNASVVGV